MIALCADRAVAQPSTEENRTRALELFEQSADHYKRGEFERAVELLREAYGLYPEPLLLYNLARALESLGDLPGAIEHYERYLAEATTIEDRAAIERRLATLKEQHARTQAPPVADPPTPPVNGGGTTVGGPGGGGTQAGSPIGDTPITGEVAPRPSAAPYFVAGGGVAIAAAGGVFGYLARAKEDDARAAPIQEDAARLLDDARRSAQLANVLFVAGGVVFAGGVTWAVIERTRGGSRRPTVAGARLDVAPAWVGLTWELR
ncbi:MAG: hypothetical protein K8M05_08455 [Deltaproteobacteria bacterium]|nr:hypothetical protein [Kofleriaceae bacterium]